MNRMNRMNRHGELQITKQWDQDKMKYNPSTGNLNWVTSIKIEIIKIEIIKMEFIKAGF